MKDKFDKMTSENSDIKKKVRRRIKKRPEDKKAEKRAKMEDAARNRVYLSSSPTKHVDFSTGGRNIDGERQPSRFRAQSADWKAGMEETVPVKQPAERKRSFGEWLKSFTPLQWACGFMAVVIFITSMTSTVVYANYRGEQQVKEAYKVLAAYDETTPVMAAATIEEEDIPLAMEEPEEIVGKSVSLVLSSVEKDLKIKVVDEEDNLVQGILWRVSVTDEDQESTELTDDDKDGVIYAEDMAAGNYSVVLVPDASVTEFILPTAPMTVAVKAKVEYKVIQDIRDLIKKESEINVAAEDTGGQQAADVETGAMKDTVEFVESTKTPSGTKPGYVPADKSTTDLTKITAAMSPSWIHQIRMAVMDTLKASSDSGIFGNHIVMFPTALLASENGIELNNVSVTNTGSVEVGGKRQLSFEIAPENYAYSEVLWESLDTAIATVDNNGVVTGVKAGTVEIRVTIDGKKSNTGNITVNSPAAVVNSVKITGSDTLTVGGNSGKLTATSDPASENGVTVIWKSSDTSVIDITDSTSVVSITPKKAGTAKITAEIGGVKSPEFTVTVKAKDEFTISPTSTSVEVGKTFKIVPSSTPVTFKSSDDKVATVAADGTVKGIKTGTAKITVTHADGGSATCTVTVTTGTEEGIVLSGTATVATGATTKIKATLAPTSATVTSWVSSDTSVATIKGDGTSATVTGVKAGTTIITATASTGKTASMTITVKALADKTELFDKNGNKLYVRTGSAPNYEYRRATYADYQNKDIKTFYIYGKVEEFLYTGWQTIDGLTYFFKKDHTKVTGEQVIGGVKYNFASDGSLTQGSGTLGIDVSKYQPSINWASVKASGISYVIIRCGYRGSSTGVLVEDPYFRSHIKGAKAAGLKVGVYFFTTAVTEAEAVEEASMCAALCSGYGINYPVFIDCESSPRAGYNGMAAAQRTAIIKAFCNTVKSAGYTPGVYANKTWLTSYMNASELSAYKIWLAQYNPTVTYKGRYDLWQFTSQGSVNGINGRVDMNQSYLGY